MPDINKEPAFEGVAKRKLDDLLARGWRVNGYTIQKGEELGLVTTGSLVGWWTVVIDNLEKADARIETQAAEIARLRAALERIAAHTNNTANAYTCAKIARAALQDGEAGR